jgi:hypothetical protein
MELPVKAMLDFVPQNLPLTLSVLPVFHRGIGCVDMADAFTKYETTLGIDVTGDSISEGAINVGSGGFVPHHRNSIFWNGRAAKKKGGTQHADAPREPGGDSERKASGHHDIRVKHPIGMDK